MIKILLTVVLAFAFSSRSLAEISDEAELANIETNGGMGDMIIAPEEPFRTAYTQAQWPDRTILFVIEKDKFDLPAEVALIRSAMDVIERYTCVRFKDVSRQRSKCYVRITRIETLKNFCLSHVGHKTAISECRSSRRPFVNLGVNCIRSGIIIHELMHALGFEHEHCRPDRDKYVEVVWKNIAKGQKRNFDKMSRKQADKRMMAIPYDYHSIMHYGPTYSGKDKKKTLIVKDKRKPPIGNRRHISHLDVTDINSFYGCPNYRPKRKTHRKKLPFHCNFDNGMCGFTNDFKLDPVEGLDDDEFADDNDWVRTSGKTPSPGTGPNSDSTQQMNNRKTGSYVYVESSAPLLNSVAKLRSPVLTSKKDHVCISFLYHMHGKNMGTLAVMVREELNNVVHWKNVWERTRHQSKRWLYEEKTYKIHSKEGTFQVLFVAATGPDFSSDMAIDNIVVTEGVCG